MPIEKTVLGGLTTYVASEVPAGRQPELVVVLCHGYGASGRDLIPLSEAIGSVQPELPGRVIFLYPAGPLDLSEMGIPYGRAWWPIDLDRLLNRPTAELLMRFRRDAPAGMIEARGMLDKLLAQASQRFGLALDRFVLGGFSQGSMLATDVALRMTSGPAALCILSGALTNEREWRELADKRALLTIVQSHGRQDQILMYPQATALRDLLSDAKHNIEFVPFDGGHEIPAVAVQRLAELLERAVRQSADNRKL